MTTLGLLESRAAITDLIHRYALNIRNRTPAASAELFTDDIVFEVEEIDFADPQAEPRPRSRSVGKADVLAHITRSATGQVRVCPTVNNILVEVEGDTAHADCLMSTRIWPTGTEVFGQYDDHFAFDGTRWRFRSRRYTIFLSAPR